MIPQNSRRRVPVGFTLVELLAAMLLLASVVSAKEQAPKPIPLTPAGQKLMAEYSGMLDQLQGEIAQALPEVDPGLKKPFMSAYRAQTAAKPYKMKRNEKFAKAVAHAMAAAGPILDIEHDYLASDKLDGKLVKATVISEATPRGLAAFAQQSDANKALIDKLLSDTPLMKQMLVAGGAYDGNYGRTMQIYTDIQKASSESHSGILQRLALGTALEQKPVLLRGKDTSWDAVGRYMNYQKAYQQGELDPHFPIMTTWECRFITNDPHTNKDVDWIRMMERNYEPDWLWATWWGRYVDVVHGPVGYSSTKYGLVPNPGIQQYIAGGAECGGRAWVGRLALRAFGIPTWGVRERGHAALSHWTPTGWVTHLGAGFESAWWEGRSGDDFYLETQARWHPEAFMRVLRARWTGEVVGDEKPNRMAPGTGGYWYAVAKCEERAIVASGSPTRVIPSEKQLASKYGLTQAQEVEDAPLSRADAKITVDKYGNRKNPVYVIHVPAVAFTSPKKAGGPVIVSNSFLGGMQLQYVEQYKLRGWKRNHTPLVYTIDAPKAGQYNLFMKIVLVKPGVKLNLTLNGAQTPEVIVFPYTAGRWQEFKPLAVTLKKGKNVLQFEYTKDRVQGAGVTLKYLALSPVFEDNQK